MSGKALVLIGGGHAHMITLAKLQEFTDKGVKVTVIQPSTHHYYSGMGPGMLGGTYTPEEIRFDTKKIVEEKGGNFVLGKAYRIDPQKQVVLLEGSKNTIEYDVLSCNAGSFVPKTDTTGINSNVFSSKPIEELKRARAVILEKAIQQQITVAVIGSGPSAIEIAGNVHQLGLKERIVPPRIKMFGGKTFMTGRPPRVGRLCRGLLEKKNIEIIENGYVLSIEDNLITLADGSSHRADIIFPALGVKPSEIFARSGLAVGPDGGLVVNSYLQSTEFDNIFGGGDCIHFENHPLDKVGVYAVRQNPVLFGNLMAALEGSPLQEFSPGGSYLLIYNLGGGLGVLSKWSITFGGKLPFLLKNYIDKRFIKTFQN